jgi:hypothetical protein
METIYNEYKSKHLKIGDMISILNMKNNNYLSVGSRDFMYFEKPESGVWENFEIVSVSDETYKQGDMIRYGYRFLLKSHKTGQYIGYYNYNNKTTPEDFHAATYHTGYPYTSRVNYIIFSKPDNSTDYIENNSEVIITLKCNTFTGKIFYRGPDVCLRNDIHGIFRIVKK